MEAISFSRFKKATHHKKVKYVWTSKNEKVVKEFKINVFYCNPYGSGEGKMYSMPGFNLSAESKEWFEEDNKFIHKSEYGETVFEIIE